MPPQPPTFWDFAMTPWFAILGFLVTTLGTILGVIAWRQAKATNRINDFLFRQAEKNIDKELTDEEIREKKTEAARISDEIAALRNRIEVEIPIEAKRTVLKDRIDGNIKNLHQTLDATLDLKRQLEALGTPVDIPPDLINAVKAEILPEYIENAQHEQLKSYLIILLVVSALTSAVVPGELALIIQMPLLVLGVSILTRLLKGYAARLAQAADPETFGMISAALFAGALTAASFGAVILYSRWPHERYDGPPDKEVVSMGVATIAIALLVFSGWLVKVKRRWFWRVLAAFTAVLGMALALFSALVLSDTERVGQLAAAYVFLLVGVIVAGAGLHVLSLRRRSVAGPTRP